MSQRTRYQEGTIVRIKRRRIPDYWALRWWEADASGKRIRRKAVIGPVSKYPTEATARKAAEALRMTINEASSKVAQRPISVSALIEHIRHFHPFRTLTHHRDRIHALRQELVTDSVIEDGAHDVPNL